MDHDIQSSVGGRCICLFMGEVLIFPILLQLISELVPFIHLLSPQTFATSPPGHKAVDPPLPSWNTQSQRRMTF